jgi:hypothetical protein
MTNRLWPITYGMAMLRQLQFRYAHASTKDDGITVAKRPIANIASSFATLAGGPG